MLLSAHVRALAVPPPTSYLYLFWSAACLQQKQGAWTFVLWKVLCPVSSSQHSLVLPYWTTEYQLIIKCFERESLVLVLSYLVFFNFKAFFDGKVFRYHRSRCHNCNHVQRCRKMKLYRIKKGLGWLVIHLPPFLTVHILTRRQAIFLKSINISNRDGVVPCLCTEICCRQCHLWSKTD